MKSQESWVPIRAIDSSVSQSQFFFICKMEIVLTRATSTNFILCKRKQKHREVKYCVGGNPDGE